MKPHISIVYQKTADAVTNLQTVRPVFSGVILSAVILCKATQMMALMLYVILPIKVVISLKLIDVFFCIFSLCNYTIVLHFSNVFCYKMGRDYREIFSSKSILQVIGSLLVVPPYHNTDPDIDCFLMPWKNKISAHSFCTTQIDSLRNHFIRNKLVYKNCYLFLNENSIFIPNVRRKLQCFASSVQNTHSSCQHLRTFGWATLVTMMPQS